MRFEQVAYVNFLDDESLARVFDGDLHPERILDAIALQTGIAASNPGTLVVLDEIQECPRALTSLKMFAEQRPDLPVIAAGSLLGVALHRGVSFPVGKVDHLLMYPMTFHEYLLAKGKGKEKRKKKKNHDQKLLGEESAYFNLQL